MPSQVPSKVRRLHASAVRAGANGRPADAAKRTNQALRLLGWPGEPADPPLAARLLLTLAHAEAELGRTDRGLALLDRAESLAGLAGPADSAFLGTVLQQRGLLLLRIGRTDAALRLLDAAIPLLQEHGEPAVLARTLLNRGVVHLAAGRIRLARADLLACGALAAAHDLRSLTAKVAHNLGSCDLATGDVPAALRAFETAAGLLGDLAATGTRAAAMVDRARALLAAGLDATAADELDQAIGLLRRHRLSQDLGEAELARAQAALGCGDPAGAKLWSGLARRRFTRRGNPAWAALATLLQLRADLAVLTTTSPVGAGATPVPPADPPGPAAGGGRRALREVARRAERLGIAQRGLGLPHDAGIAELLALRARVAAGDVPSAQHRKATRRIPRQNDPLDERLLHRLTRAELHRADRNPQAALDELRKGLDTLQQHRSRFGSLELQGSVAALGMDLGTAGLDIAWSVGPARRIFNWSELARAQSFRIRPVLPPQDPLAAETLAELRQLRLAIREGELAGRADPGNRARCAELEQRIRRLGWGAGGPRESRVAATDAEVQAELAATGRRMVSFLVRRDRLHALVLDGTGITLVELGDYAPVAEAVRRLLSDLDAVADRRLPPRLAAVVRASADRQAAFLSQALISPVLPMPDHQDLVLIPTRQLAVLPWGLLPGLRGRPVAVAPSATAWLTARTAGGSVTCGVPLLVAGPHLRHADAEIEAIAGWYPRHRVLEGAAASAGTTLAGMDGALVVHVAAHGHHDTQNVLFSRLELADGPLLAYELQRLGKAPWQVVLSACDVGRAVVRAGDEVSGFTAALLHAGAANVVASVARVPDAIGPAVMAHYHEAIAAGVSPARALASLPAPTPFVCFGAG